MIRLEEDPLPVGTTVSVLTLPQPWATIVVRGLKRYVNVPWPPSVESGDLLAIHALKKWTSEQRTLCTEHPGVRRALCICERLPGTYGTAQELLPRRAVLALMRVVTVQPAQNVATEDRRFEEDLGTFKQPRIAIRLSTLYIYSHPQRVEAPTKDALWDWHVSPDKPLGS